MQERQKHYITASRKIVIDTFFSQEHRANGKVFYTKIPSALCPLPSATMGTDTTFPLSKFVIRWAGLVILFALCSCQTNQVQNPPAQTNMERQAKIEKALRELKSNDANVRHRAVFALGGFGAKEYANDIVELLRDKDVIMRRHALLVLEEFGVKEYAKDIAELLKDKDSRHDAVHALGKLGAKEYAKNIAELLKDGDAGVRGAAVWALGKLGAKEYARDIAGLLKDNNVVPNEETNAIHTDCYITTISYEAERVLKEWNQLPADGERQTEKDKETEKLKEKK